MSYRQEDPSPPYHYGPPQSSPFPPRHQNYHHDEPHHQDYRWNVGGAPGIPSNAAELLEAQEIASAMPFVNIPPSHYKHMVGNFHPNPYPYPYHRQHLAHYLHQPPPSRSYPNIPNLIPIQPMHQTPMDFGAHHRHLTYPHHYLNTHAHDAPTLRHILTHHQPSNHSPNSERMMEEGNAVTNGNGIVDARKTPIPRKRASVGAGGKGKGQGVNAQHGSEKQKPSTPRGSRIAWKKRYYAAPPREALPSSSDESVRQSEPSPSSSDQSVKQPQHSSSSSEKSVRLSPQPSYSSSSSSSEKSVRPLHPSSSSSENSLNPSEFSSPSAEELDNSSGPGPAQVVSPKELDLSVKKPGPKRKRDTSQPEVAAGITNVRRVSSEPPKKLHLLSQDHKDKSWIKKGVVVKSIQHDRPMGTIIGANQDKSFCILHFFKGWKAEIQTKFLAPVLSEEDEAQ